MCCLGGKCPNVYTTDDGHVLIQGAIMDSDSKSVLHVPSQEDVVKMDRAVFEKIAKQFLG